MTVFKNLLLPMELMEWMVRRFSELDCPDFLKSRGFGGNFGWFLGGMFVFGSILTIYVNQMRKFWEKGGKNVRKNDGKVRKKYVFVRKKYRNIRILDIRLARLCENVRHGLTLDLHGFFKKKKALAFWASALLEYWVWVL